MTSLRIYDPFADAAVETLFGALFGPARTERPAARAIRLDVTDTDDAYVVHAELPGIAKDAINVAIEGDRVTITADAKRVTGSNDNERVLRTERHYGGLYRSFTLPVELDEAASKAKYENGVLELTLVKKPTATSRTLTIQ